MSMGYGANYADVIESETIKSVCPKEYNAFMDALKEADMELDEFAQCLNYDDLGDEHKELHDRLVQLVEKVEEKSGMVIFLLYHDSEDNGDRYDDVDGAFWSVDNLYVLNPKVKRFHKKIQRKFFVTFG